MKDITPCETGPFVAARTIDCAIRDDVTGRIEECQKAVTPHNKDVLNSGQESVSSRARPTKMARHAVCGDASVRNVIFSQPATQPACPKDHPEPPSRMTRPLSPGASGSDVEMQVFPKGKVVYDSKTAGSSRQQAGTTSDRGPYAGQRIAATKPLQWRGEGSLLQLPWQPPHNGGLYLFIEPWSGISTASIAMMALGAGSLA